MFIAAAVILILLVSPPAWAFNPPVDTAGPLTVQIMPFSDVSRIETRLPLEVRITNSSELEIRGKLRIGLADDWRVAGSDEIDLVLKGGQELRQRLEIVAGGNSHAALYPIHAWFTPEKSRDIPHAIAIVRVLPEAIPSAPESEEETVLSVRPGRGLALEDVSSAKGWLRMEGGTERRLPPGFAGTDPVTGAVAERFVASRPGPLASISVHPPWKGSGGEIGLDYRVSLPDASPVRLTFSTAIRDSRAGEPLSDGVEFRVLVSEGGEFREVFRRFSASKSWEPAEVDLSGCSGKTVTLRFVTAPGPNNDTTCDHAYWGLLTVTAGPLAAQESDQGFQARAAQALADAKAAMGGAVGSLAWQIGGLNETCGAAVVPGPNGILDAAIAFAGTQGDLVLRGVRVDIDGETLGGVRSSLDWARTWTSSSKGRTAFPYRITPPDGRAAYEARVVVFAENGALRLKLSMPGVTRDVRGHPRFTAFGVGPGSRPLLRVYAGFGSVIEHPEPFELPAGGFTLSTRHVGADYDGGLSLVQAADIFPDVFSVDPPNRLCSLVTDHDATISLIPSSRGAFAAARVYREQIAGFKPAAGVEYLKGRMCLDSWRLDVDGETREIELCRAYGMSDAIFVKHNWQRWGYDYRLPDIYPPLGGLEGFKALSDACKKAGINFVPHDNYVDLYPDADGYSYDLVWFNEDGTPQLGWLNEGRKAQSYHFSPNAFMPFLIRNRDLLAKHVKPDGIFVDVFSSLPPMDFYDRGGNFFPKTVCAAKWAECFDAYRKKLTKNSVTVSEAGCDALIGHLDAGESDHGGAFSSHFGWGVRGANTERVPWHDMASHGSFILFAGGLGQRYNGGNDDSLHGYASDDYLSMTVLGGRNPMCDGPFNRRALMTYWLLHDVCASLAREPMTSHSFDGDIHRQRVTLGDSGVVVVNRGAEDWETGGVVLPQYGFTARCGGAYADVRRRDGVISAYAESPDGIFVDARTQSHITNVRGVVGVRVAALDDLGGRRARLRLRWDVVEPLASGMRPFVHFDHPGAHVQMIAFQADTEVRGDWSRAGSFEETLEVSVPADVADGGYPIRFGFYDPAVGTRAMMRGRVDSSKRAVAGLLVVNGGTVSWQPEDDPLASRLNTGRKILDFGPVATNGAFRMTGTGAVRVLTPLPGSDAFEVSIAAPSGASALEVQTADLAGKPDGQLSVNSEGGRFAFTVPEGTQRCLLTFRQCRVRSFGYNRLAAGGFPRPGPGR